MMPTISKVLYTVKTPNAISWFFDIDAALEWERAQILKHGWRDGWYAKLTVSATTLELEDEEHPVMRNREQVEACI